MRRVAAIAVVHDTLSTGLSQIVDFDVVFDRVLGLAAEVASLHGTTVHPHKQGRFGELPSEYATPLALALTEIVTNAVEHGLAGREGEVIITAERNENSVLFSLDALRAPKPAAQAAAAPRAATATPGPAYGEPPSGIVDIKKLASIAPPWAVTIFRLMDRPRPVPALLVV